MIRRLEFPLEDGGTFLVEVDESEPESALKRAGAVGEVVERAQQTFQSALENLKPAAAAILAKIRELSEAPDEVAVEFGIKLSTEFGVVLAKATGEGNYKITLRWKKEKNRTEQSS